MANKRKIKRIVLGAFLSKFLNHLGHVSADHDDKKEYHFATHPHAWKFISMYSLFNFETTPTTRALSAEGPDIIFTDLHELNKALQNGTFARDAPLLKKLELDLACNPQFLDAFRNGGGEFVNGRVFQPDINQIFNVPRPSLKRSASGGDLSLIESYNSNISLLDNDVFGDDEQEQDENPFNQGMLEESTQSTSIDECAYLTTVLIYLLFSIFLGAPVTKKQSDTGKESIGSTRAMMTTPTARLPSSSSPPKRPRRTSFSSGPLRIRRNTTSEMPSCAIFKSVGQKKTCLCFQFFLFSG